MWWKLYIVYSVPEKVLIRLFILLPRVYRSYWKTLFSAKKIDVYVDYIHDFKNHTTPYENYLQTVKNTVNCTYGEQVMILKPLVTLPLSFQTKCCSKMFYASLVKRVYVLICDQLTNQRNYLLRITYVFTE